MFVGGVVSRDEVDFLTGWCDLVNHAENFQPLLMAVPFVAHPDDGAIERAHRCE